MATCNAVGWSTGSCAVDATPVTPSTWWRSTASAAGFVPVAGPGSVGKAMVSVCQRQEAAMAGRQARGRWRGFAVRPGAARAADPSAQARATARLARSACSKGAKSSRVGVEPSFPATVRVGYAPCAHRPPTRALRLGAEPQHSLPHAFSGWGLRSIVRRLPPSRSVGARTDVDPTDATGPHHRPPGGTTSGRRRAAGAGVRSPQSQPKTAYRPSNARRCAGRSGSSGFF